MKEYCFGIDVGGTTIKIGFFKNNGEVLDKWEITTRTENFGENILADICEALERWNSFTVCKFRMGNF